MKDFLLIPNILVIFALSYYILTKVDRFIEESHRLITDIRRSGHSKVRIAAESPALLRSVSTALKRCSRSDPHIVCSRSIGRPGHLLEKLLNGRIDIVLLTDKYSSQLDDRYTSLLIPYEQAVSTGFLNPSAEDSDDSPHVLVVWKSNRLSKDRDRVIYALENEQYRLKCGYIDY